MSHPFKHFVLITKHRHRVIKNATHMGIFWHALKHDLTKYGWLEFHTSAKYYKGNHSPVFEERLHNEYYSTVCQHHTKRNPHHWEYWTDFFGGRVLVRKMPWKYACEYVCDVLSASYTYNPKHFEPDTAFKYFENKKDHYYMNNGSRKFISWALKEYSLNGWKNLNKKNTKAKYKEFNDKYPDTEFYESSLKTIDLPVLKEKNQ